MGETPKTALPPQDRAASLIHSMQRFYSLGYGEIADWSPLEPTETPGEVKTTMMKYWLLP
ncbi:hypothetical protein [Moorena producens]|uniref:hypothetical protein n=1 Tax=Moorena producens TaxID=1155739 RepID=UPI003C706417